MLVRIVLLGVNTCVILVSEYRCMLHLKQKNPFAFLSALRFFSLHPCFLSAPRIGATMVAVGSHLYVFGGRDASKAELSDLYSFNTVTQRWTLLTTGDESPPHRWAQRWRRGWVWLRRRRASASAQARQPSSSAAAMQA